MSQQRQDVLLQTISVVYLLEGENCKGITVSIENKSMTERKVTAIHSKGLSSDFVMVEVRAEFDRRHILMGEVIIHVGRPR